MVALHMSAFGGKADMQESGANRTYCIPIVVLDFACGRRIQEQKAAYFMEEGLAMKQLSLSLIIAGFIGVLFFGSSAACAN